MDILKRTDQRFEHIERKVGLFILIGLIGIFIALMYMAYKQEFFTTKKIIYFYTSSGKGLYEGQPVRISGFSIGNVEKLYLDDIAKIKVSMSIKTKYLKWIKRDSTVTLTKDSLIGDSVIDISTGKIVSGSVKEYDALEFVADKDFKEMITELRDEIVPVLIDIKDIIKYIKDPDGDLKLTIANLHVFTSELTKTGQQLNILLSNADDLVKSKNKELADVMQSTNQLVQKVDASLPPIIKKIDKSIDDLNKITQDVSKMTEAASEDVPAIVKKAKTIAGSTDDLLDSAKKMWPFSSYLTPAAQKLPNTDSSGLK
ncbi:MlaD family protein [Candidatus Magnetomonas plexicatena]|uniref:MlaD family protein n=1 Tax=Candidatus Magnetomonas plexicatena TaxID=2552947 RepID=UPI001C7454C4|nr:MCE family protein [Nitrospirales bacterium LBB_01]